MLFNNDDAFYSDYSARVAEIKGIDEAGIRDAVRAAFNSVFRLVAFDVDGTLTPEDSPEIDEEMARLAGRLMERGVEVALITGRGRSASRTAAERIIEIGRIEKARFSRLSVITHNGLYLLETPPGATRLLSRELTLTEGLALEEARRAVEDRLVAGDLHKLVEERTPNHEDLGALRVELADGADPVAALAALEGLQLSSDFRCTSGRYGSRNTIDISPTDKGHALDRLAELRGIDPAMILRVGDRGAEGGNDYAMLDSPAGFSVRSVSKSPVGCWPVLGEDLELLAGVEATSALVAGVLLFPPLSTAPQDPTNLVQDLLRVEGLAQTRARKEALATSTRLRLRAAAYAAEQREGVFSADLLRLDDLYDPWSGAVRLRDWELPEIPEDGIAQEVFELPRHDLDADHEPICTWSTWSDTGMLLRGPKYYVGLCNPAAQLGELVDNHLTFIAKGVQLVDHLEGVTFSVVGWKLPSVSSTTHAMRCSRRSSRASKRRIRPGRVTHTITWFSSLERTRRFFSTLTPLGRPRAARLPPS